MQRATNSKSKLTTADRIIRVTMKRIRSGGFANVSMRQVADDLGITATALYHHFKDKDALLDRVVTLIFDSIPIPDRSLPWTERLRRLVLAQHAMQQRYPGISRFVLMRRKHSLAAFRWIESILEVLLDGGLSEKEALMVVNQLAFLIDPMTYLDVPVRRPMLTFAGSTSASHVLKHSDKFPRLASLIDRYPDVVYEEAFASALDALIAGLKRQMDPGHDSSTGGVETADRVLEQAPRRTTHPAKVDNSRAR